MARDLLLIISRIEWAASCIDNMNNRSIFFKKCVKSLKILLRGSCWEASLYLSSYFYSRWFVSLFSVFIWTKWWLKNYCIDFFHTFFVYIFGRASASDHSHKKQEDSLETRAVLIEIFMLCWNLPSSPKHRGWLQKKHCFPWRE